MNINYVIEDDEYNEITLDIEYYIYGKYYPPTLESPEEFPDLEIALIINSETGEEYSVTDEQYDKIVNFIWDEVDKNNQQINYDPKPFYW